MTILADIINITIIFIITVLSMMVAILWRQYFLELFNKFINKDNMKLYTLYVTIIAVVIILGLLFVRNKFLSDKDKRKKKIKDIISNYV